MYLRNQGSQAGDSERARGDPRTSSSPFQLLPFALGTLPLSPLSLPHQPPCLCSSTVGCVGKGRCLAPLGRAAFSTFKGRRSWGKGPLGPCSFLALVPPTLRVLETVKGWPRQRSWDGTPPPPAMCERAKEMERGASVSGTAPKGGGSSDPRLQPWHQPCGFLSCPERAWGCEAGSADGREVGPALGRKGRQSS